MSIENWVNRRNECSYVSVFRDLRVGIENDVKARNDQLGRQGFVVKTVSASEHAERFRVERAGQSAIDFSFDKAAIYVHGTSIEDVTIATLALNDDGDCRLNYKTEKGLQLWQFRKRTLEDLFFGA